jgi:hypothetical protein
MSRRHRQPTRAQARTQERLASAWRIPGIRCACPGVDAAGIGGYTGSGYEQVAG